MKFKNWIYK